MGYSGQNDPYEPMPRFARDGAAAAPPTGGELLQQMNAVRVLAGMPPLSAADVFSHKEPERQLGEPLRFSAITTRPIPARAPQPAPQPPPKPEAVAEMSPLDFLASFGAVKNAGRIAGQAAAEMATDALPESLAGVGATAARTGASALSGFAARRAMNYLAKRAGSGPAAATEPSPSMKSLLQQGQGAPSNYAALFEYLHQK